MEKIKKINKDLEKISGTWRFFSSNVERVMKLLEQVKFIVGDDKFHDAIYIAEQRLEELKNAYDEDMKEHN